MIEEIIAGIAMVVAISGVTLKDLISTSYSDKSEVKKYIKFLEGKQVLTAPFNQEILPAVIASIEVIKKETEATRIKLSDENTSLILLNLVLKMSEELMILHKLDNMDPKHSIKMYKSIQEVRAKFSKALVLFSAAYNINLSGSNLASMVLDFNFKPRVK